MKHSFLTAVALHATLAPATAGAITYTAVRAVGAGSVAISITTDDTLGVLATANIVDWTITISDSIATFTLLGPLSGNNSQVEIAGTAFSATANDLIFDYDAGGSQYALFQSPVLGSAETFYCIETNSCDGIDGPRETIQTSANSIARIRDPRAGAQSIASAAVPEPASWALMIGGFGLVGSAVRRRRATFAA